MERKQYAQAEQLFRRAIAIFTATLSPQHINTGIARIKLGHALVCERRYAEAVKESRGGYEILVRQINPSVSWLQPARQDMAVDYADLKQPQESER